MVLVDAGPLVALIHADDQHHERCKAVLRSLREPMATVWPAFTEAMYLLNFSWRGQEALWEMLERALLLLPLDSTDVPRMRQLMDKYKDLPMDLADSALVRVAEREKVRRIFTLDRRDFQVYRPSKLGRFSILPASP
ncbi:MAG: type II toxin-antitoxin system VapC family toxin [bacterium]